MTGFRIAKRFSLGNHVPVRAFRARWGVVTPIEIKQLLARRPFVGFRLHMTDGRMLEIRRPDVVLVLQNRLHIGLDPDAAGVVARVEDCWLQDLVRVEDVPDAG